jgi:epoxide hydrolase
LWCAAASAQSAIPGDITLRPLAGRDHNLVHWAEFSSGSHFAAMEAPGLLPDDVRKFLPQLR